MKRLAGKRENGCSDKAKPLDKKKKNNTKLIFNINITIKIII